MTLPDYQPQIHAPALSDDELMDLDDTLQALPGEAVMNIEGLDGYLTGLLLAPRALHERRGGDWLPLVWGGEPGLDLEATAPFASGKQRKKLVLAVLRHLKSIDDSLLAAQTRPEAYQPVISVAETEEGQEISNAEDWCRGFMTAVDLDALDWEPALRDPERAVLLLPIVLLGTPPEDLAEPDAQRLSDDEERDALSRAAVDAAVTLYGLRQR